MANKPTPPSDTKNTPAAPPTAASVSDSTPGAGVSTDKASAKAALEDTTEKTSEFSAASQEPEPEPALRGESSSGTALAEITEPSPPTSDASGQPPGGSGGGPGGDAPTSPPKRILTPYGALASLVLLLFWLLPITYVGAAKKDVNFLPLWLRHQQRISCLFINHAGAWADFYVQIQRDGKGKWEELSEAGYFEMQVFGYRSRLHRILSHSYKKGRGVQRMRGAANFIRARYKRLNPKNKLDAVRFVRGTMSSASLARQTGCYKKPLLHTFAGNQLRHFGEVRWDGKRARHAGNGRTQRKSKARTARNKRPAPQHSSPSSTRNIAPGPAPSAVTPTVTASPPTPASAKPVPPSSSLAPRPAPVPTPTGEKR